MAKARPGIDFVLGKNTTEYRANYDPSILAREPRQGNRKQYKIEDNNLPFVGFDTWHAYEISFLTNNGRPVNGVLKLRIPADSKYIVESKSIKLYLFSYNMEKLGATKEEAIKEFLVRVNTDLEELLEASVSGAFQDYEESVSEFITPSDMFTESVMLERYTDDLDTIVFDKFEEDPAILKEGNKKEFYITSDLVRSNCKITHQPDWGTVFIKFKGDTGVDMNSLAQYLVSFRGENHFHEEIVECLYIRLLEKFKPKDLMVTALYTRRGGIDICPVRATSEDLFPTRLGDIGSIDVKDYRQ
jgi:7-cyano-7-deazaguanine reductase